MFLCLSLITFPLSAYSAPEDVSELSFDIWDWTAPAQDPALFKAWVDDLARLGFTRIELSVPWRILEPEPGRFDLQWLEERIALCEEAGVGMRLRINSYYGGATPGWYSGDRWLDAAGNPVSQQPPSIMDEGFWEHYGQLCGRIAALGKGKDILYNAFIGIHGELKYADWWSFDPATLSAWQAAIQTPRPAWLQDVVGDAPLPERPGIPPETGGTPDTDPANLAFIAFREHCWRQAAHRFVDAIQAGDPDARVSAPLGESYRRQSASMSNLDYWGLTRGGAQVVHSYDFVRHGKDPAWMAAASVDTFQGITGLPVVFEFDGTTSMRDTGYSLPQLIAVAQLAGQAGAAAKFANNSYTDVLPSKQPWLGEMVRAWREAWRPDTAASKRETVLLFFSKWANYAYRESTEWLYEAQAGVYKLFFDARLPMRIICEDNLDEDLSGYRALYLACSPRALMPRSAQEKLNTLPLLIIEDFVDIPAVRTSSNTLRTGGLADAAVETPECPLAAQDLSRLGTDYQYGLQAEGRRLLAYRPGHVVMGYPLGALYLHDPQPAVHQGLALWALQQQ